MARSAPVPPVETVEVLLTRSLRMFGNIPPTLNRPKFTVGNCFDGEFGEP